MDGDTRAAQKSEEGLCLVIAITATIIEVKAFNYLGLQSVGQPLINRGKEISSISLNSWYQSPYNAVPL